MPGGEKKNRFVAGLKPRISFEIWKDKCMELEEETRMSLRIEAALNYM